MNICLFVHNHQPLGVSDEHLRQSYENGWLPLLLMIRERKNISVAVYNNAVVWDWLKDNGSDYLAVVKELLDQDRVELIGGAAYEPLLPLITDEDAMSQTGRMSRILQGLFSRLPRGFWLEARLWEPWLPSMLARADIEYILSSAGLVRDAGPVGPLIVDDRGQTMRFMPVMDSLIDEQTSVSQVAGAIRKTAAENPDGLIVLGADLDLFAVRKGQAAYPVEKAGALLDLLVTLSDQEGLSAALPCDFLDRRPVGRAWPGIVDETVSLRENMARRASVDSIYRKMLHVSKKIQFSGRPSPETKELLARGQCGTAFLSSDASVREYREALWHELLAAEDNIDGLLHGKGSWVDVDETDFNGDGHIELLVGNRQINTYFAPNRGGAVFEIDFKPRAVNVLDSVLKREALFSGAFIDCFPVDVDGPEAAARMTGGAMGWDAFAPVETGFVSDRDLRISFTREGLVARPGEDPVRVTLEKVFRFAADQADFKVRYRLVNRGPGELVHPFAVAFGLRAPRRCLDGSLLRVDRRDVLDFGERGLTLEHTQELTVDDPDSRFRTAIQFTMCSRLFLYPIAWGDDPCGTLAVLPVWDGPLPEGEILELDLAVEFEALEGVYA